MRLYLDTNVYSFVHERNEAEACAEWLRDRGHLVLCSDNHLLETMPIADATLRGDRLRLLCLLSGSGGLKERRLRQDADLIAQELLEQLAEHKPDWLRFDDGTSDGWRSFARRRWQDVCRDPGRGVAEWDQWAPVFSEAASGFAESQKVERGIAQDWPEGTVVQWGAWTAAHTLDPAESDALWRLEEARRWWWALKRPRETPSLKGLRDYSGRVRLNRIDLTSWQAFWRDSIRSERMSRHRAVWMVSRVQLGKKIRGKGNMWDSAHSVFLVDADAFLTADRGFYDALTRVAVLLPGVARPLLLDRKSGSALEEIRLALDSLAAP